MIADFRFALRGLRRTPAFFGMAILTLGLGIAANTAIFSLFYQVLLRTLPVPDPERLVVFHSEGPGLPGGASADNSESVFSYPMYLKLRDGSKSFQSVAERSSMALQTRNQIQNHWKGLVAAGRSVASNSTPGNWVRPASMSCGPS